MAKPIMKKLDFIKIKINKIIMAKIKMVQLTINK